MKRSERNVLQRLANLSGWTNAYALPDGNGYCDGRRHASGYVLRDLRARGLVEYGKEPQHSLNGYRITDAGRAALAQADAEKRHATRDNVSMLGV